MADSNITKRALGAAMKDLMEEFPFNKIQVSHICEKCNISRKIFYYHFQDKYDLLNWIFDTETFSLFQSLLNAKPLEERMDVFRNICYYFYENRNFYRKAFKINKQNSFSEHFRECIASIYKIWNLHFFKEHLDDFAVNFFTDAVACTIERWLREKDCMPPEQFFLKLKVTVLKSVKGMSYFYANSI